MAACCLGRRGSYRPVRSYIMGKRKRDLSNTQPLAPKRSRGSSNNSQTSSDYDYVTHCDYVTIGNFIYVRPYVFEFKCHFKPRWRDRTVFDVFVEEFRHVGREYWVNEFYNKRVLADGRPIDQTVIWTDGCKVVHVVHRHESAVLATPIYVAVDHDGFVVVSKPPSMPVHPCGTYRRNTLQFLLRAFHGYGSLLCVHRLDKETSGLVILAKTTAFASRFTEEIKQHKFTKTYVAEVVGMFPDTIMECLEPIFWDKREMRASIEKHGLEAKTAFSVLARNSKRNTSIVECRPFTGRTHQIRIHLAHLGHPIVNDPLYGDENLASEKSPLRTENLSTVTLHHEKFAEPNPLNDDIRPSNSVCGWVQAARRKNNKVFSSLEEGVELGCTNCPQVTNSKNVAMDAMVIHLHALRYKSDQWTFEVPPPPWMYRNDPVRTTRNFCTLL